MTSRAIRRLVIPLLVLLLSLAGVIFARSNASASGAGSGKHELRVMAFNIGAGRGSDGDVSIHRTAYTIRQTGAEVVALQEVDVHWSTRSDFRDQASELADLLGMHVYFAPVYSFPPDYDPENPEHGIPAPKGVERREFGRAVLSEYPIIDEHNHRLTIRIGRGPDTGTVRPNPGFPEVTINVNGTHLRVFSAHLQAGADERATDIRATQVDEVLDIIGAHPQKTVLLGDLNASVNPDSPVYRPEILPLFDPLNDAWELAGTGPGFTFRADHPDRRIDFILTSPDIGVSDAQVVHTEYSAASDHLPVIADLTLGG